MTSRLIAASLLALALGYAAATLAAGDEEPVTPAPAAPPAAAKAPAHLAVLWTSADPEVAHNVCFMYTGTAKSAKWFDDVELIVWGPSANLLAEDEKIQAAVKLLQHKGVRVRACIACARNYGVVHALRDLGIEVRAMGGPLTEILKSDCKVLTF